MDRAFQQGDGRGVINVRTPTAHLGAGVEEVRGIIGGMELHGAGKLSFRRRPILLIVGQHAEAFMHDGEIGVLLHGLIERGLRFRETARVNVQGGALGIDFGGRQGAAGVALRIAARDSIEISNIEAILARVSAHPIREFLQIAEGLLRRGNLIAAR